MLRSLFTALKEQGRTQEWKLDPADMPKEVPGPLESQTFTGNPINALNLFLLDIKNMDFRADVLF